MPYARPGGKTNNRSRPRTPKSPLYTTHASLVIFKYKRQTPGLPTTIIIRTVYVFFFIFENRRTNDSLSIQRKTNNRRANLLRKSLHVPTHTRTQILSAVAIVTIFTIARINEECPLVMYNASARIRRLVRPIRENFSKQFRPIRWGGGGGGGGGNRLPTYYTYKDA